MRILFVCTGNTCRSPMAEAIAKEIFKDKNYEIASAGISVMEGQQAGENAILAAEENGLNLKDHQVKQLTPVMIKDADLILTMTNGHKQAIAALCTQFNKPVFTLAEYTGEEKDIADPFGCDVDTYKACFDELKKYMEKIYEILGQD